LSSRRKLLRLLSLVCGVLLIVFSVFLLLFYRELSWNTGIPSPYPELVSNIYYIMLGVILLILGIALIVASYYRHGETNLPMKI
jgi:sulfite exporter TauE/SafE